MASRVGSFPLGVAVDSILNHGGDSKIVLDPFCGKGTSLTATRLLNKYALGIDASPEAVALSLAKIQSVTLSEQIEYLDRLKSATRSVSKVDPRVRIYYSDKTLGQILSLRHQIEKEIAATSPRIRANAIVARGLMLGILHGHSTNSLSVKSSHSISFAPEYVRRFCERNGLRPPDRNVKECLKAHAHKVLAEHFPECNRSKVFLGDAANASSILKSHRKKVDLILTSPPYLHKQTYAKDNWLRLWYLGFDHKIVKQSLIETADLKLYKSKMLNCIQDWTKLLKVGGKLILITGSVRKSRRVKGNLEFDQIDLGNHLELVSREVPRLRTIDLQRQIVAKNRRRFGALSKSRGHSHYEREEQIVVIEKYA